MSLAVGGIGSGLDINGIIAKLMVLERRPLALLEQRESDLEAELSAFGQLKSAISTFENVMSNLSSATQFQQYTATSTDTSAFTATADSTAVPGSYTINVTSLAKQEKVSSTNGFADGNTSIGETGTIEIDVGGNMFSVVIDGTNDTLNGIRDTINNDVNNTGVTASVINVDDGFGGTISKLVLTADTAGSANSITVSDATPAGLNKVVSTAFGGTTTLIAGSDASVTIDGLAVTSTSNTISGAIQGITLNLTSATGVDETLTVAKDMSAISENVQQFVDAYNDLRSTLRTLGGDGATLEGNTALLSIESQMRTVLNTAASGLNYSYLAEIGITTNKDTGDLQLDSTRLNSALSTNINDVAELFANNNQGFAYRFKTLASNFTATDGVIDARQDGINTRISNIDDRKQFWEYRLTQIEERLVAQFSAMDSLVASLNTTSEYLAGQLANLPGMFKKS